MLRVKICCIRSISEAKLAIEMGASALGFVSAMPSGPGVIPESLIAEIVATVPPPVATFLLTSKTRATDIIEQQRRCRVNTIQLCDRVDKSDLMILRNELFGVSLVQVVHVADTDSIEEAGNISPYVDALLLDSGNQNLAVKELGGTGRIHDWSLSKKIVDIVAKPVFLAGGINATNIRQAVSMVKPFGVDLCNGVRTDGQLDKNKLKRFMSLALNVE